MLSSIRQQALTDAPRSVVTTCLENIDDPVKAVLPKIENLQKNASRRRKPPVLMLSNQFR
jgi:hypothetical protein